MRSGLLSILLLLCGFYGLAVSPGRGQADESAASSKAAIFDETADASRQISNALATAKKDGKNVLLDFGANWCVSCHRLHTLCETDPGIAGKLKKDYVVVMIDVNKRHNKKIDARYGNPTRLGIPVLVVLDANGRQLTTKDSGELEKGDHHDPAKVMAFLDSWGPKK